MHPIEPLELRIAPATLLPGGKGVTYTDLDGDLVTLKTTLPVQSFQFIFDTTFETEGPQQLRLIDFTEGSVGTFSVTMTVKRGPQGDGLANVGEFRTDEDMETVTIKGDLGRLIVGDADPAKPGIKALNVNSLGALGTATQLPGGSIVSNITGGMGTLKVRSDLMGVVNVLDATEVGSGKLGSATIGGSMIGDTAVLSGVIATGGDIGSVTVKGNIRGGDVAGSGQINAGGSIGNVVVGGSLLGNSGGSPGSNVVDAPFGSGAIIAGRVLSLEGAIKSVTIGGDMHGDSGTGSGSILIGQGVGDIGSVTVKGSMLGGTGNYSGMIWTNGALGKLTVGGSIVGNSGTYFVAEDEVGQVWAGGQVGPVKVTGDVIGGSGNGSGRIETREGIASVTIGGSLVVGNGSLSGAIKAGKDIGKVSIKNNLDGRDNSFAGFSTIEGRDIASVTVGGFLESGVVRAKQQLGAVSIGGYVHNSLILGHGEADAVGVDIAIKSVKVKGSVIGSQIIAGFYFLTAGADGNADAQIGSITVGGDWIASSAAAGVNPSDSQFGDGNDGAVGFSNDSAIISRIASIAIKGQVIGSTAVDHFGFVAQHIGSVKIGGFPVKLTAGPINDVIELMVVTGDVTIREIPPE
jgi:hypothetical protein